VNFFYSAPARSKSPEEQQNLHRQRPPDAQEILELMVSRANHARTECGHLPADNLRHHCGLSVYGLEPAANNV